MEPVPQRMELSKTLGVSESAPAPPATSRELAEAHFLDFYRTILRYLVVSGSHPTDAEDVAQETFLRLYLKILTGATPNNLKNWLFRVAYNVRIDRLRSGAAERLLSETEWQACGERFADESGNVESAMLDSERTRHLQQAMRSLTARQAEYLALRAEGLTYREIAGIHSVAIATVAEACGHAMEKLSRMCSAR